MNNNKKVLLVVEDEEPILRVLSEQLRSEGFEVLEAVNGEVGLKLALEKHPDFILVDLLMPKMGGLEMIEELREDPWGEKAPTAILTNLTGLEPVSEGLKLKTYDYLIKSDWSMENIIGYIKEKLGVK